MTSSFFPSMPSFPWLSSFESTLEAADDRIAEAALLKDTRRALDEISLEDSCPTVTNWEKKASKDAVKVAILEETRMLKDEIFAEKRQDQNELAISLRVAMKEESLEREAKIIDEALQKQTQRALNVARVEKESHLIAELEREAERKTEAAFEALNEAREALAVVNKIRGKVINKALDEAVSEAEGAVTEYGPPIKHKGNDTSNAIHQSMKISSKHGGKAKRAITTKRDFSGSNAIHEVTKTLSEDGVETEYVVPKYVTPTQHEDGSSSNKINQPMKIDSVEAEGETPTLNERNDDCSIIFQTMKTLSEDGVETEYVTPSNHQGNDRHSIIDQITKTVSQDGVETEYVTPSAHEANYNETVMLLETKPSAVGNINQNWDILRSNGGANITKRLKNGWNVVPFYCKGVECHSCPLVATADHSTYACVICGGSGNGRDGAYCSTMDTTDVKNGDQVFPCVDHLDVDQHGMHTSKNGNTDTSRVYYDDDMQRYVYYDDLCASINSDKLSVSTDQATIFFSDDSVVQPMDERDGCKGCQITKDQHRILTKEIGKLILQGWTLLGDTCPDCTVPLMMDVESHTVCIVCGQSPRKKL